MKNQGYIFKSKLDYINSNEKKLNIMEVCGTHTMAIGKHGLRYLLNENINLISGPGCPVCVTPNLYIDYIFRLSLEKDIIIATYGDMIRVPGSRPEYTLENARAQGATIKMVYSSMDALKVAEQNQNKMVVFLGIGFETTAPATAIALKEAINKKIKNFYILSLHKLVEPVMKVLLSDEELTVDGFICPGHVAVIIGENGFKFLEGYKCSSVIAGFEPEEIIDGIYHLVKNINDNNYKVINAYNSIVRTEGNIAAQEVIKEVFEVKDDIWRGIGEIQKSGLKLKKDYIEHDIETIYPISRYNLSEKTTACQCGDVLKGKIKPVKCKLFRTKCTPENPIGPCMVSGEGSCSAYYRYSGEL
jgi:hydrogenase expression/formation protein HypD